MESILNFLAWQGWNGVFTIVFCLAVFLAFYLHVKDRRRQARMLRTELRAVRYAYVDALNFVIQRCRVRERHDGSLLKAFEPPAALTDWNPSRAALGQDSIALSRLHERVTSYNDLVSARLLPRLKREREAEARRRIAEIKKAAFQLRSRFGGTRGKSGKPTAAAKPAAAAGK